MSRLAMAALGAAALLLAAASAAAQEKPAAPPLRESAFADCQDGADNDGDGHVDCADQDCGIYAMCVCAGSEAAPPAAEAAPAPAPEQGKMYTTMKELKRDLRAHAISGRDFARWQRAIRLRRAAELDQAEADLHARVITHAEFHVRVAEIKAKYEG